MFDPYWELLLLMLLIPLAFPLARLIKNIGDRVVVRWQFRKLIAISRDLGIDTVDMLKAENASDMLLLVQAEIAAERTLLSWRLERHPDSAGDIRTRTRTLDRYQRWAQEWLWQARKAESK